MLKGQPLTAIIPARAGSKGIPGKNLWRFGGYTLLERAIRLGKANPSVDRTIVSTDSPEMQEIAEKYGVSAPTLRPAELASDSAKTVDVVLHLLDQCGIADGYVLLLQVTSPLRTRSDLVAFLSAFESANVDAAVSVVKHDEPRPEKLQRIENGLLKPYAGKGYEGPRQALAQPYAFNGAFYVIAIDTLREQKSFLPAQTLAFEMPPSRSHNLDALQDMEILQAMIETERWKLDEW
jgi:CMP-N,N'-diacetyllegionaminic acid synthase